MPQHEIVSRDAWLAARKELLAHEKALTRQRDAVNAARRRLPMVRVEKDYAFAGPEGRAGLKDLFAGRRQLIVYHFMFDPDWEEGCRACSFLVDNIGHLSHLHARDTTLVLVSRAPFAKIQPFQRRMGWTIPWYSSFGSDFNHDFHVTLDERVTPVEYNYRNKEELLRQRRVRLHRRRGARPQRLPARTAGRSSTPTRPMPAVRTSSSAPTPIST